MINCQTCTEVYELFELMDEKYKQKIPVNIWNFINENKFKIYDRENMKKNILNGILSDDSKNLYGALKLTYLCEDDLEKRILTDIFNYNDKSKRELAENNVKNITTDIFEYNRNPTENRETEIENKKELIEYKKDTWIRKLFNKILKIFKKS